MSILIIAEAGVNHNGDINIAKRLIDVAADCGANAVKFQTFKADRVVSRYAQKADYQKQTTNSSESQLEMISNLQLEATAHKILLNHSMTRGIMFLSTPFDLESITTLNELGLETFKIPSGELTNLPYLRNIGRLKRKIILSTGMANMGEIEYALNILTKYGTNKADITVLHCNTEYPTPIEDVNLLAMLTIRDTFKIKVGYSDHTSGIDIAIAAAALGASVIEKHFTLDKNMQGPDHKASLEPAELKNMVIAIRNIEKALGDGIKKPSRSELKNIPIARKSIVADTFIKEGEMLTEQNITVKRPGIGISPIQWDNIIGRKAKKDFKTDELIEI
ncbi:N-acetylneuraminic acid synthetase [Candidatus Magnetoovum chiemensis]|nr:N-acetylneuraminic acid synthetase [Candidatus Magnetoovum chiemensis]